MKQARFKIFAVTMLAAIGTVLGTTPNTPDAELEHIAHYRDWTRITPQFTVVPREISSDTG